MARGHLASPQSQRDVLCLHGHQQDSVVEKGKTKHTPWDVNRHLKEPMLGHLGHFTNKSRSSLQE